MKDLSADFGLVIALVIAIAALGGGMLLRGPIRFLVFVVGLLVAAIVAGLVTPPALW